MLDLKIFKNKRNNQIILIPRRKRLSPTVLKYLESRNSIKLKIIKARLKK